MNKRILGVCVAAALFAAEGASAGVVQDQQTQIDDLLARVETLESQNAAMAALLSGVSRNGSTLVLTAMNLQIVNGLGSTDGDFGFGPTANGLGNLIVGYDEVTDGCTDDCELKTGSHSIIVGPRHEYTSYGSVVVGVHHRALAPYASALGGTGNYVSGQFAVAVGGANGGSTGNWTSVFGGEQNFAGGDWATAVGGYFNNAQGENATAVGGDQNDATGAFSVTTGGFINTASGPGAVVSGGYGRSADGVYDWVAGTLFQDE